MNLITITIAHLIRDHLPVLRPLPNICSLIINVDLATDPFSTALLMGFTSVTPDRTTFGIGVVRRDGGPWRMQGQWAFNGASLYRAAMKLTVDHTWGRYNAG